MTDNDPIDVLVREVGPSYFLDAPQVTAALDNLGRRITSTPKAASRQRPSRGRRVAATAAVAAVLAAAAPAAAHWVSARTGRFGDPARSEEDGSEWLRLGSPEIEGVVRGNVDQLDLPLPAGVTPAGVTSAVVARLAPPPGEAPGLMQEGGVRLMIAWDVACRWGWSWLDGRDAASRHQIADIARDEGALPAALTGNDDRLAQQIVVNCPADTK